MHAAAPRVIIYIYQIQLFKFISEFHDLAASV